MEPRDPAAYQPFYCEENAWHLAARLQARGHRGEVLVITSRAGRTPLRRQRVQPRGLVWWDYHVVVRTRDAEGDRIWDPDTSLPFPCPTRVWLGESFPDPRLLPPPLRPWFRAVPLDGYLAGFGSDRHHMRSPDGGWLQPPPPWPPLRPEAPTLATLLALDDPTFGAPVSLEALLAEVD